MSKYGYDVSVAVPQMPSWVSKAQTHEHTLKERISVGILREILADKKMVNDRTSLTQIFGLVARRVGCEVSLIEENDDLSSHVVSCIQSALKLIKRERKKKAIPRKDLAISSSGSGPSPSKSPGLSVTNTPTLPRPTASTIRERRLDSDERKSTSTIKSHSTKAPPKTNSVPRKASSGSAPVSPSAHPSSTRAVPRSGALRSGGKRGSSESETQWSVGKSVAGSSSASPSTVETSRRQDVETVAPSAARARLQQLLRDREKKACTYPPLRSGSVGESTKLKTPTSVQPAALKKPMKALGLGPPRKTGSVDKVRVSEVAACPSAKGGTSKASKPFSGPTSTKKRGFDWRDDEVNPYMRSRLARDEGFDEESDYETYYENNYSSIIQDMFGYNRRKYMDDDYDDDRGMEASYDDIRREEKRSAAIGRREDEIALREIQEEERRRQERRKKKRRVVDE